MARIEYRIPSTEQLRDFIAAEIASSGLTHAEYAKRKGVSIHGLRKVIQGQRGANLEFARKLVG